jgi:hypothetical protein
MRQTLLLLAALFIFLTSVGFAQAQSEATDNARHVHFIVIKAQADPEDVQALRDAILELAGGYTEFPETLGSSMHDGKSTGQRENISFMVTAKENIAAQLKRFAAARPSLGSPYIVPWQGAVQN